MSTGPHLARQAARLLSEASARLDGDPPAAEDRAQAIRAIEAALRGQARRRRLARLVAVSAGVAATAAAVVAVTLGHWRQAAPPAVRIEALQGDVRLVEGAGSERSGAVGAVLSPGDRVVAPAGADVMIAFALGTRVSLGTASEVTLVEGGASTILRLSTGTIHAQVAKLHAGERFVVRTLDAEVEVRGTRFEVASAPPDPRCGAGTSTRVRVTEGVVVVRARGAETSVEAGGAWPTGCDVAPAPPPVLPLPVAVSPSSAAGPGEQPRAPMGAAPASGASATAGSLAAQNAACAEAVNARRSGNAAGAAEAFARFLTAYPASPLAESAAVERMRILSGAPEGRAAARQYLMRFPGGYAREEAARLAGPP
jgi:hypothetical protein